MGRRPTLAAAAAANLTFQHSTICSELSLKLSAIFVAIFAFIFANLWEGEGGSIINVATAETTYQH